MALIASPIISSASGSIAGLTLSRNAGGMYIRARAVPVNPSTGPQVFIRAIVAFLSNTWVNTLTQAQRDAWALYADNVPLTGPLGASRTVSGIAMYIRSNVPRIQALTPRVDTAPSIFDTGDFTPVTDPAAGATAQQLQFEFTNTDAWANEALSFMAVYASRPQNPSINFFTGPYLLTEIILGDITTPPTSPAQIDVPFPIVVGQRLFWRVVVSRNDGRYSSTQRQFAPVAA